MAKLQSKRTLLAVAISCAVALVHADNSLAESLTGQSKQTEDEGKQYPVGSDDEAAPSGVMPSDRSGLSGDNPSGTRREAYSNEPDSGNPGRTRTAEELDAGMQPDHHETVEFNSDSVELTTQARDKLEDLVDQLEGDGQPVMLTVWVKDSVAAMTTPAYGNPVTSQAEGEESGATEANGASQANPTVAEDSSTYDDDGADPTATTTGGIEPISPELEETKVWNAKMVSRYRAENIRQYLEDNGVEVAQWHIDGLGEEVETPLSETALSDQDYQHVMVTVVSENPGRGFSGR